MSKAPQQLCTICYRLDTPGHSCGKVMRPKRPTLHNDGCAYVRDGDAMCDCGDGRELPPTLSDTGAKTPHGRLATDAKARKDAPIARGVLDYFPNALAAVAELSRIGNEQHNPGQPMHWAKEKSTDHADCIVRHLIDRGTVDTDGVRHAAKVAWRALALLQTELESLPPASK